MRIAFDMVLVEREKNSALYRTYNLIRELVTFYTKHEYIVITACPQDYTFQKIQARIRIRSLKIDPQQGIIIQHQLHLPRILQKIQPDIVHIPNAIAPIGWPGPFILNFLDSSLLTKDTSVEEEAHLYWNGIQQESARRAQGIVTVSEHMRTEIRNRWSLDHSDIYVTSPYEYSSFILQIYQELVKTFANTTSHNRPLLEANVDARHLNIYTPAMRLPEEHSHESFSS